MTKTKKVFITRVGDFLYLRDDNYFRRIKFKSSVLKMLLQKNNVYSFRSSIYHIEEGKYYTLRGKY